ncbi:hypothetical protein VTJ83DRAFT_3911 [Remersonia thermophila]|uniref:Integral membrane protein n=1 Tax=Remersonia thermophila TaxID=72144 RepID=A0ABR4DFH5_9PEZI
MAPPIVTATVQATILSIISNLLAQAITAHQSNTPLTIDWITVFQYSFFAALSTPPNFAWQGFLESTFPAFPTPPPPSSKPNGGGADGDAAKPAKQEEPRLSKRNTALKLLLDQTAGATFNTVAFSLFIHSFRQATAHLYSPAAASAGLFRPGAVAWAPTWAAARAEFWPLVRAGWRFWPWVALGNYVFLTSVEARTLAGALAGLAWGVYISLATAAK